MPNTVSPPQTGAALARETGTLQIGSIEQGADGFGGFVFNRLLASNGDVGALRTCGVLRSHEWELYDQAVVQIARGRFSLVADLMANGMSMALPNALGVTSLLWDRIGDMDDAEVHMTPEHVDRRSRLEFSQDGMPIPIIHTGFMLNIRHLMAARRNGTALDTMHARNATLKVVEGIEKLFLTANYSVGAGSGTMYGITTYPYRNTGSLVRSWLNNATTGAEIFKDVNAMIAALENDNQFGPYGMYVPANYMAKLREDYDTTTAKGRSIYTRLMEIENLKFIKSNRFITGDQVIMIQLSPETMEVIDGIQPQLVEWSEAGGFVTIYKVIAIVLPRIKRDAMDQCGIAHFS